MKTSEELLTVNGEPVLERLKEEINSDIELKILDELKQALEDLKVKIDEKLSTLDPTVLEDYGYHCYYSGMKSCAQLILDTSKRKELKSNGKVKQENICS